MKQDDKRKIIMLFVISLFLPGCSVLGSLETTPVTTSEHLAPISKLTEKAKPTPTINVEVTKTATAMSVQDKQRLLTQIFETNGGCQLPCYWGIVPGETSWDYASQFLSALGRIYGPGGAGKVASYGPVFEDIEGDLGEMIPEFWVRDGVVVAIMTNTGWVQQDFDYNLAGLLVGFGIPEEIWVRPIAKTQGQPYYYLALWYPSKGILVDMQGNATKNGDFLSICPQDIFSRVSFPPRLVLWNPKEQVSFRHFDLSLIDNDLGLLTEEYELLSKLSIDKLTNEDFFEIYKKAETETCITVIPVH